jgi:hypothetical protein
MALLATFDHLWEPEWNPIRNYQTVSRRSSQTSHLGRAEEVPTDTVVATVSVSSRADHDNGGRELSRGPRTPLREGGLDDGVMGILIAMKPHHCERFIEHTTEAA